jgi:oxalate decarboxylase/phosphoglucose isomerase-like protein (cupin superfamily)
MSGITGRRFIQPRQVETQVFDWGRLQWMSEPRVTGAERMAAGIVTLEPGKGHTRHNHPGVEEILYVIDGEGRQVVDLPGEPPREVTAGTMIHIPAGIYHSTVNTGAAPMRILAVYSPPGPEAVLRSLPGCRIEPPESPDAT